MVFVTVMRACASDGCGGLKAVHSNEWGISHDVVIVYTF